MTCTWICLYAPVNPRNRKEKEEMRKFWNYVHECPMEIEKSRIVLLIVDMNEKVTYKEIAGLEYGWSE